MDTSVPTGCGQQFLGQRANTFPFTMENRFVFIIV